MHSLPDLDLVSATSKLRSRLWPSTNSRQDIKGKLPVHHLYGFLSEMVKIYFKSSDLASNATSCGDRSETCH